MVTKATDSRTWMRCDVREMGTFTNMFARYWFLFSVFFLLFFAQFSSVCFVVKRSPWYVLKYYIHNYQHDSKVQKIILYNVCRYRWTIDTIQHTATLSAAAPVVWMCSRLSLDMLYVINVSHKYHPPYTLSFDHFQNSVKSLALTTIVFVCIHRQCKRLIHSMH